ncbi:MAG: AMP-binding protein [Tannerella sp.]|jgi:long-chain acyl-CoA synthetase|nr:AMP-binding protein [Tannerella sp.]
MKKTIVDLFEGSVKQFPNNTFLLEKTKHRFEATTYAAAMEQVRACGAGLISLGVERGDHVAILSEGCNAWILGELAIFYAGAVNVPLSIKLEEANDLLFRLQHAEVKYIMVSGNQLKKIRAVVDKLPFVKNVIIFDPQPAYEAGELPLDTLHRMGRDYLQTHPLADFLAIGQSLQNDTPATVTYTSGTTADPKGVILTHRNYTANVEQSLSCVNIDDSWRTLVILPLDHCFAHVVGFFIFMYRGASVATVQVGRSGMETLKNIPLNIREVKPHLILSVPALAKNFRKNIEQGIRERGKTTVHLFRLALRTGYLYHGKGSHDRGRGWRILLYPLMALFDRILFAKIRRNFGGELKFFISGGALLDKDLQKFYCTLGIPMYQGYGLSEATPVLSTNGPKRNVFGSSGMLVQPLELKICDAGGQALPEGETGEIVVRGENVTLGYWKNPVATAEILRNGWLHTGDMGHMKDGMLYVMGRFKSLLIGNDGEKYSPEGIEEAILEYSSCIEQVILYNNQRPYTVALLVPNRQQLKEKLAQKHLDLHTEKGQTEAVRLISRQLNRFRKGGDLETLFPTRWFPTSFAILPEPWTEQNGMINSTMKVVRGKVEKAFMHRIEHMFTPRGKDPENDENLRALSNC